MVLECTYTYIYIHSKAILFVILLVGMLLEWSWNVHRPLWASLGLSGPLWASLGLSGPLWASLHVSGPLWASLGLSGFCMYIPTYVHTCTHYAPSFSRESEYDVLSETGSTRCTNSCDDALVVISTSGPLTCDILLNAPVTLRA